MESRPVLLAVDSDRELLAGLRRDLSRRFEADYRTVIAESPEAARDGLAPDDEVAMVIAGQNGLSRRLDYSC